MTHTQVEQCDWLYIAGYGRSGSTLVESYIAEHCDVLGIGELYFLWDRGFLKNEYVASGVCFNESKFWTGIIGDAFGDVSREQAVRYDRVFKRFLGSVIVPEPWDRASDDDYEEIGEILRPLARAIADRADGRTIIDSSKYPMFGAAIARTTDMRMGMLHCFRHPAAVAHSWSKVKKRPEAGPLGEPYMARSRFAGTSAWRWKAYNFQAQRLAKAEELESLLVPYEDFCKRPREYLELMTETFGLQEKREGDDLGWHSVSGNPARFRGSFERIKIDDAWQSQMGGAARSFVNVACGRQYDRLRRQASSQFGAVEKLDAAL